MPGYYPRLMWLISDRHIRESPVKLRPFTGLQKQSVLECFLEISVLEIISSEIPCKAFSAFFLRCFMKDICKQGHRHNPMFSGLPENQGQTGRHKCSGCAYDLGKWHAMIGVPKFSDDSVLAELPESQASQVRHKDAFTAYLMGYDYGLKLRSVA